MRELSRDGDEVVVSVSLEELRLLLGTFNEALNGPYAMPSDEWRDLVGQPPERAAAMLAAIETILDH